MPELLDQYDEARCEGYPRGFKDLGRPFGADSDLGIDLRGVAPGGSVCGAAARRPGQRLEDFYNEAYPMARYKAGQRVCLVYPSRNHRAMELPRATNTTQGKSLYGTSPLNLPDGGMYILASPRDPKRDLTIEDLFDTDAGGLSTPKPARVLAPLGESAPGVDDMRGYSNCPAFGVNDLLAGIVPDDALGRDACGQCFIVPRDLAPGAYTFHWFFRFNNKEDGFGIEPGEPDEDFLTCFDVVVEKGGEEDAACPLAGDDGGYPGNVPGTGRHAGVPSPTGYTAGGPIDPSSILPCEAPAPSKASPLKPKSPPLKESPSTAKSGPKMPQGRDGDSDAEPIGGCAVQWGILFDGARLNGNGTDLILDTSLECCAACRAHAPSPPARHRCNMFAHCPIDADPADCPPGACRLMHSPHPPVVNFDAPEKPGWASGLSRCRGRRKCATPTCNGWVEVGSKRPGGNATFNDAGGLVVASPEACCAMCEGHGECRAWTMDRRTGACALKAWAPGQVADPNYYSGIPNSESIAGEMLSEAPCPVESDVDFPGPALATARPIIAADSAACCRACERHAKCYAWSRDKVTGECQLKGRILGRVANESMEGGTAL
ncbi:unnamed protein product [Ostreobium quekettii]|uniref:Apple domain-containing protein n=1 Tax=Ostreobium quekettii TaxID=121088 RepID=A0A8S1IX51_9CHLO|nr:unnamed protein product [Ostreobium quekettii]